MKATTCASCGEPFEAWVEFCPSCGAAMEGYARPAGFWIRVGATIIDWLVFIPIGILSFWNLLSLKSTAVLVLISVPGFVYKPFLEAFCGATLGKMACGIKVIDDKGKKLSLFYAYVRSFPFLMSYAVGLAGQLVLFSLPAFQDATSLVELGQVQSGSFLDGVGLIINVLIGVDCVVAAFAFRKRALHDMLAESFCV
ncbi:MAG: RDD family protein, partial [Planctomycetota bacterium]